MTIDFRVGEKDVRDVIVDITRQAGVSHLNIVQYDTKKDYTRATTKKVDLVTMADFIKMPFTDASDSIALGISSLVRLNGGSFGHLCLLDADGITGHDIPKLNEFLSSYANGHSFGKTGFVADSGNGLHLYSYGILIEQNWRKEMQDLAKGSKFVDPRYAELSLERNFGTLRLNATSQKPTRPRIILSYKNN